MFDIFKALYVDINRKKYVKKLKPRFVFWYVLADGDQKKISEFMDENYGVDNVENFNRVLKDVDFDDYIFCLEKGFHKYVNTITVNALVLKKSDCVADYLFNH